MERVITPDIADIIRKEFSTLQNDVRLLLFTKEGLNDKFNEISLQLCSELAELSSRINLTHLDLKSREAEQHGITTSPVILLSPDKYRIQFMGAPIGEEGRSLIASIAMVSSGRGMLSAASTERIRELKEPRELIIFVSPTCPYCPQQVAYAVSAAVEAPDMVSAKVVEIFENRQIADRYSVVSVPQTVVSGNVIGTGIQPEEVFVDSLFAGAPVEMRAVRKEGETVKRDLVIVGSGPAGLTASIYAERSGLSTVVIEKGNIGGQVAITPVVENYPGYTRIPGKTLMDMMAQQALQYTEIRQGEQIVDIKRTTDGLFDISTTANRYSARAVILATGAEHIRLGIPGEERFFGRGVSYCATCDGYFFKDGKKVMVVGGGNTAVTELLYLESIGVDVTLLHRRDELRAEERLQQNLRERNIPILWETVVEEIIGDAVVNAVKIRNLRSGKASTVPVDGIFIAVGFKPANELAEELGVKLTEDGYILVDEGQRTSLKGLYAAGDITGGVKQISTAVGQGSIAAITAFEDISSPYWKPKESGRK